MFIDNLKELQKYKEWIANAQDNDLTKEQIKFGNGSCDDDLEKFIQDQKRNNFWKISSSEWKVIVEDYFSAKPNIVTISTGNQCDIEEVKIIDKGCFDFYIKNLENNGYSQESLCNIVDATKDIFSRLSQKTLQSDPIRGLVMGNVQSGKTANMAALIALAADYGFNMFIVLSGTIENLRVQTEERLASDLKTSKTKLSFELIKRPSVKSSTDSLSSLHIEQDSYRRYLTVCLKNTTRLKELLNWLNSDPIKKSKLKILVIDDESDQAGVNTANLDKNLRSTISDLINKLVFAGSIKPSTIINQYAAMNYVAYTATPYANFLNDASSSSLYPKNFISSLKVSNEYFGPQQIFGAYDSTYNGLSIINDVQENEVASLKSGKMPKSMKEAICWFICTVAIFRFWDLKKPLTMLIHTSSTQQQHAITKNMIENFFNSITNTIDFVNEIEKVYNTQCSKFTKEDFRNQYNDYGISDENINDYPIFDNIRPLITELVEAGLTHINIAYDGQLEFKDNLHLCIDNCYSSKSEDDEYLRLAYPRTMERAKAFIVVGGATLSRGLTLEGLTTSYFIRSSKQADSLMQMGRWFGYRKKYELLPRIWFTNQTLEQFKYLSELDEDLRKELASMGMYGKNPAEYGPRIKKLPKVSELSISAKNKTQRMVEFDIDYSGVGGQTTLLYKDEDIIDSNYDVTIDFINGLGKTNNGDFVNSNNNSSHVWLNVDFNSVFKYLSLMKVPQGNNFTRNFDSIKEWYETQFNNGLMNNFNVVLYGLKTKKTSISLENIELNLSSRSPFDDPSTLIYKFGVITDPKALTMDIDQSNVNLNENEKMSSKEYRNKAKYDKTPVLVLYVINKYSETKNVEKDNFGNKRVPLEASNHLVAYDFYIPQGDSNEKHRSTITVKIENDISKVDNEESE